MKISYILILMNFIVVFTNNAKTKLKGSKINLRKLNDDDSKKDILIIGFSDYKEEENKITFKTMIKDKYEHSIQKNSTLSFEVDIFTPNNDKKQANCVLNDQNKEEKIYLFNCSVELNKKANITRIEIENKELIILDGKNTNVTLSSLAKMKNDNIKSKTSKTLSPQNIIIMKNAEIVQRVGNSFIIKADNGDISRKIILVVSKNGLRLDLPCNGINHIDKNDETYFYLNCSYYNSIENIDLNDAYGYYPNQNNKSFLLEFNDTNSTTFGRDKDLYYKSSTSGLSTGGIIAIIIPLIIVLLLVLALVFVFRGKSPTAPPLKEMVNNNSLGVMGSSEVVVKQ